MIIYKYVSRDSYIMVGSYMDLYKKKIVYEPNIIFVWQYLHFLYAILVK